MRILETAVWVLLMIMLIWAFKQNAAKSRPFAILSACAFLIIIMHLFIEGWRWQMVLAYGVGAVMLIIAGGWFLKRQTESKPPTKFRGALRIILSSTGILLLLISGILSWALPVFRLPVPTGPYQIGVSQWFLTDESREETLSANPGGRRELNIYAWYPADASGLTKTAEYLFDSRIVSKEYAKLNRLPGFFLDYLRLVRTHSYTDAPISNIKASYPVLVFSHGYDTHAGLYTALMEELASLGYIVFSIGHTYESVVEAFPDGRQARFAPPQGFSPDEKTLQQNQKEAEEINPNDLASIIKYEKKVFNNTVWNNSLSVWSADTRFVIDWLEKINRDGIHNPFYQKLDLNKLGAFGMSFGGKTTCTLAFEDRRIKAALNMDGPLNEDIMDHPLETPFMFMLGNDAGTSSNSYKLRKSLMDAIVGNSHTAAYNMFVKDAGHGDFTDISIWCPLAKGRAPQLGKIDGYRMMIIVNTYVPAFFNKHLKGIDSPLLNGPSSDFPEVIFKARKQ
jgi:predicted dienelactone hydrolase